MSRPRKWLPAEPVTTLDSVAYQARNNGRYILWNGRLFHPSFIANMQLLAVSWFIAQGQLRWCSLNPDYKEPKGGSRGWGGKRSMASAFRPPRPPLLLPAPKPDAEEGGLPL